MSRERALDEKFTHLNHQRDRHQPLTFMLRLAHVVIKFGIKAVDLYLQQKTTQRNYLTFRTESYAAVAAVATAARRA